MAHKAESRRPSSDTDDESLAKRVSALEKALAEIIETFDPKLADRVEALEKTLQRHGIRPRSEG